MHKYFSQSIMAQKKQQGTVLVTVLLVVAFVVILVVEVSKTVNYQTSLNRNLMNRDQAFSYLIGMEELAKIYLKKSFDAEKQDNVHLGQSWAQEDIMFPIDGGAMVATIRDMQSCLNINSINLPDKDAGNGGNPTNPNRPQPNTRSGQPNPQPPTKNSGAPNKASGEKILTTLLERVLEDTEVQPDAVFAGIKDWIDADFTPSGPDGVEDLYYQGLELPYLPANGPIAHVSELRTIKNISKETYEKLRPYICVLPDEKQATLNVNTIPLEKAELLYAAFGGKVPQSEINELISDQPEEGYEDQNFLDKLSDPSKVSEGLKARLGVTSKYFQMDAKAEINTTRVYLRTLFIKEDDNQFKVVSRYFGKE